MADHNPAIQRRGRRSSDRIRLKTSFARFTNTAENPLCPDMESDEEHASDVQSSKKRKRESTSQAPRSLNQHMQEAGMRLIRELNTKESDDNLVAISSTSGKGYVPQVPEVVKLDSSNSIPVNDSGVRSILRTRKNVNSLSTSVGHLDSCRRPISISSSSPTRFTISSSKKVQFAEVPKRNKRKESVLYIESDSDFANPVPTVALDRAKELKARKVERRKNLDKQKQLKNKGVTHVVAGIRTRTSPMMLHETIDKLTLSQRNVVISMGLGTLLSMSVNGIPSKLGYYVVDNLDTDAMVIKLEHGSIPINEDVIHEILGIPNRGIDIDSISEDSRSKVLFRQWRSRYGNSRIRPSEVVARITKSGRADDNFKVDFMVLFVNSMAECSPMGCCLLQFMNKISSIEMISNINWARYILESVRRSKRIWRRDTYDCFFAGPLTFLSLLYAHYTVSVGIYIKASVTPLHTWDIQLLRARVRHAKRNGGLGMAALKGQVVMGVGISSGCRKPHQSQSKKKGMPTGKNQPDNGPSVRGSNQIEKDGNILPVSRSSEIKNTQPADSKGHSNKVGLKRHKQMVDLVRDGEGHKGAFSALPNVKPPTDDEAYEAECGDPDNPDFDTYEEEDLKQDYVSRIEEKFNVIYDAKWQLEELLSETASLFPDEDDLAGFYQTFDTLFRGNESYNNADRKNALSTHS